LAPADSFENRLRPTITEQTRKSCGLSYSLCWTKIRLYRLVVHKYIRRITTTACPALRFLFRISFFFCRSFRTTNWRHSILFWTLYREWNRQSGLNITPIERIDGRIWKCTECPKTQKQEKEVGDFFLCA
jgi:hypothetical protein